MEQQIKELTIIKNTNQYKAKAILEYPDYPCKLTIFYNKESFFVIDMDFFSCLAQIKDLHPDILILCKGYKINVYPSPMMRQMGHGIKAYELQLGKQALFENLVDIFDFEEENLTISNTEQREFYNKWISSL